MVKLCTQLSKTLRTGPGLTAKEIVEKISKLEETGGSRCKQWSEIKIGKSRNTTLAWRKIIHITQKD